MGQTGVAGRGTLRMPAIFGDHMVLQRGAALPVWGWAAAGARVVVSILGQKQEALADPSGKWRVTLMPLEAQEAGAAAEMTIKAGTGKGVVIRDILLGDVWLAGGQSNMAFGLSGAWGGAQAAAAARHPAMRLFKIKEVASGVPLEDCQGKWVVCSPETVRDFSAIGYFFGRDLQAARGMPIGLIHAAWSGTQAEGWTPEAAMLEHEETRGIVDQYHASLGDFPRRSAAYQDKLGQWKELVAKMEGPGGAAGGMLPPPEQPMGPGHPWAPANNFNGVLHPIIPFALKGVIWYQGEGNAMRGMEYRTLLPVMIEAWRAAWAQEGPNRDFPFLIVQLPNYLAEDATGPSTDPNEHAGWPQLREAQMMTARDVPNCGLVVAIDCGDPADLHPPNKEPIGQRLALLARRMVYGDDVIAGGPAFRAMKVKGRKAILSFAQVAGGRVQKGEKLGGFAIAGADQKFVWADAQTAGETVVVSSAAVKKPAAVRYLWNAAPVASLFNAEGWPAGPFRTDQWPAG